MLDKLPINLEKPGLGCAVEEFLCAPASQFSETGQRVLLVKVFYQEKVDYVPTPGIKSKGPYSFLVTEKKRGVQEVALIDNFVLRDGRVSEIEPAKAKGFELIVRDLTKAEDVACLFAKIMVRDDLRLNESKYNADQSSHALYQNELKKIKKAYKLDPSLDLSPRQK